MSSNQIIPAQTAIETFRDAGYKNTASALAELIDNSIEAGAKNIQILTFEADVAVRQRISKQIQKVAIYDDGCGMPPEVLSICLQFGNGTRMKSRKGMGRFGIGLPNASISQAKRIDVYSWKDGTCHHTYLDIVEIQEQNLQHVRPVEQCEFPQEILSHIEGKVQDTGTLIVWSTCDRLDMARSRTLYKVLNRALCRIYRHFLDDNDEYGKQVTISLINTNERKISYLQPNDPLYLMTPNNAPGYETEATNVLHGSVITRPIEYDHDGSTSNVEMRFSIVLPEIQAKGGNSKIGQHYGANTGISFVRAAREIDFGGFGYFNEQEERERWWGCEIRFDPALDELFGVTNNKQSVRGINSLNANEFKKDHSEDYAELLKYDLKLKLRYELSRVFKKVHNQLMDAVKSRGEGKKGKTSIERAKSDKSTRVANEDLKGATTPTRSAKEGAAKSIDEKSVEWKDRLLAGDTTLKDEDAIDIVKEKIDLSMEKDFNSWPGSQFFSIETTGSTCVLVINRKHPFFDKLYNPLLEVGDDKYIDALDLTLMSFARMEDELYDRIEDLDEIRDIWGRHLKNFLTKLAKHA